MFREEDARYAPRAGTRRYRIRAALSVLLPVLLLVGGVFGWYGYTQTRFYIGPNYAGTTPRVALFQGIPDQLFALPLSHPIAEGPELVNLPPASSARVTRTFGVESLDAGQTALAQLKLDAERCVAQREARTRASQAPTPAAPTPGVGSPSTTGLPSPSASVGVVTPSAPSTPAAFGEC